MFTIIKEVLLFQLCGGDKAYINPTELEREHLRCLERSIQLFKSARKMGGPEFSQGYEDQMKSELLEQFDHFQKHNESKNIFKAAMTPAVLFTVMLLAYIVAGVFGVIGLESIANMLNFVMICFLALLCTWFYLQYSGELRNVAIQIDSIASAIWEHVSKSECTAFRRDTFDETCWLILIKEGVMLLFRGIFDSPL